MISHIPHNTRIFIGLVIITLLVTYLAIALSSSYESQLGGQSIKQKIEEQESSTQQPSVDTSKWITYTDKTYPISFNHPSSWSVITPKTDSDFYKLALNVTESAEDINIYISKTGYLGMDGLKEKPYALGSAQGSIVNGGLIGLKKGEYYYTFDASMNPKLENEFNALVRTVKFDPNPTAQ